MGVEIQRVNGVLRTIYRQIDGGIIYADECRCYGNVPYWDCPIDEHRIRALMGELETEV